MPALGYFMNDNETGFEYLVDIEHDTYTMVHAISRKLY